MGEVPRGPTLLAGRISQVGGDDLDEWKDVASLFGQFVIFVVVLLLIVYGLPILAAIVGL